ncbi:DUF4936 family protein [Noviherbaspirillum pedocola]|uniref:DUF4936 family protein n=1 Tax=Noviherbaspirillum pedocola TaxID=2801341 RepID=A0A934W1Y3_9BURK|nr:DUF4936 family protein [Noviherbaspirillum pedocola]MBK4735716.1 DUF4936 family protein [Noviherbaspirillum pedocola]
MDLYVYYKVPEAGAVALLPLVKRMQRELAERHAVGAALKRRPETRDGRQTWMEVYANVPEGFAAALARAAEANGIAALIDGGRHTETFVDIC